MPEKQQYQRVVTPAGKLLWPKITKPDTKFVPDGVYDVKIVLEPSAERERIVTAIETARDDEYRAQKKENPKKEIKLADLPLAPETDQDGDATGNLILHAKMKARVVTEKHDFTQAPAIFDAKGKPIAKGTIDVWSGTIARVSFDIVPFYKALLGAGVTCRLKGVQILELVSGGGQSADAYGFGEEEGYEYGGVPGNGPGYDDRPDPPPYDPDDPNSDLPF
jgi:hypothetical protein